MRILSATLLLVAVASAPSHAQNGRYSFEFIAGRGTTSPIFQHTVPADATFASTTRTQLSIDDGSVIGGRAGYRIGGGWTLLGEVGQGASHYYYSEFVTTPGGLLGSTEQWGTASRTTFGLSVAHRTALAALPVTIEPELGVAMHRLRVGQPPSNCIPTPPSLGSPGTCPIIERWERTYSVPSVGAGLSLGYDITSRVGLLLRGDYSVGRTSTKEAFFDDLLPQYDYAEAPQSQTIRSSYLTLGLRFGR